MTTSGGPPSRSGTAFKRIDFLDVHREIGPVFLGELEPGFVPGQPHDSDGLHAAFTGRHECCQPLRSYFR